MDSKDISPTYKSTRCEKELEKDGRKSRVIKIIYITRFNELIIKVNYFLRGSNTKELYLPVPKVENEIMKIQKIIIQLNIKILHNIVEWKTWNKTSILTI